MAFFDDNVVALDMSDEVDVKEAEKTPYEEARYWFGQIHRLCFAAQSNHRLADKQFFIQGGIPADFMEMCIKNHLCAGKPGRNLFWNWSQNLTKPKHTVDCYMEWLSKQA